MLTSTFPSNFLVTYSTESFFICLFTICVPSLVGWLFDFSFAHFSKQAFKIIVVKCTWHKIYAVAAFK